MQKRKENEGEQKNEVIQIDEYQQVKRARNGKRNYRMSISQYRSDGHYLDKNK